MKIWTVVCCMDDGDWFNKQNIEAESSEEAVIYLVKDHYIYDELEEEEQKSFLQDIEEAGQRNCYKFGQDLFYCFEQKR